MQRTMKCPGPSPFVNRRSFIAGGLGAALSAFIPAWQLRAAAQAASAGKNSHGKSCILLWMNGGPSHIDTWDPKPGTSSGGKFKAIKTRASGVTISEHLPLLADQAHHLAIVRGMTSKEGNHDRARYLMHTGYSPNPTVMHPALGAWVSEELGDRAADLPSFVSLGGPSHDAGFLGAQFDPLVVQKVGQAPANIGYARQIDAARFDRRREALDKLEASFGKTAGDPKVAGRRATYASAFRMMRSSHLKAFEIDGETEATKKSYGDTDFGRGCLVARKLIEAGVKMVEVTLDGWDTHADNFGRTERLMGALDPAMSGLLKDLEQRHLLDSTLVIWLGDFGRTPRINVNDGRDHYPQAWSAVMAGGGIRGGTTYGKTDADGAKVIEKPVKVSNLFATAAAQLGLDPSKSMMTPVGRPIAITEQGSVIRELVL
jgi:uncharacterized protein DUF1501